ncbi:MAG: TRAP transporter small permease [bacterium]|nr:TRAP transporter small permease [bacterium]
MNDRLTRLLENFLSVCLLLVFVLIVALVGLRYIFNTGVVGANEAATILFVYITAIGSAIAVGRSEHIAVTFLVDKLGPAAQRRAELVSLALVALINGVIAIASIRWIATTGSYLMPATQLPRLTVQAAVPLGCGLAVLYCVARMRGNR